MKKTSLILTLFSILTIAGMIAVSSFRESEETRRDSYELSDNTQKIISDKFYDWAVKRAETSNQAVTANFFYPSKGDDKAWFAQTPDGNMLVTKNNQSQQMDFPIRALGGVVFYTALNGQTGHDPEIDYRDFELDYEINMDETMPASKYILGDNGKVYELIKVTGHPFKPTSGFEQYNRPEPEIKAVRNNEQFVVSKDEEAQAVLRQLIKAYAPS